MTDDVENKKLFEEEMEAVDKILDDNQEEAAFDHRPKPEEVIDAVESQGIEFFHDQERDGYAKINRPPGYEIIKIKSENFRYYVSSLIWSKVRQAVSREGLNMVTDTLNGKAIFEGELRVLQPRMAWHEGSLWYDLGHGRAVKIASDGWHIVEDAPVLFRTLDHQERQADPGPADAKEITDIFEFMNLKADNTEARILIMTYLCAVLIPDMPRPILVVHGLQGSAKSTLLRVIKKLLDPSTLDLLTYPRNSEELIQVLSHHYLVYFDNVSEISDWLSDDLCRACTGQAFSKRKLYTDDDDVIYHYKRAIGMNGINLVAQRPDLLDRSLLFELDLITEENRKDEKTFWQRFELQKPKLLGAIFDAISKSMALINGEKIILDKKPRLADYAHWCCAVAIALDFGQDKFMDAYRKNIEKQNAEALEASTVAQVLIGFMENQSKWRGSAKQLLDVFSVIAEEWGLKKDSSFPKSTRWLWRRIKEAKANLNSIGIDANYDDSVRPRHIILINNRPKNDVNDGIDVK